MHNPTITTENRSLRIRKCAFFPFREKRSARAEKKVKEITLYRRKHDIVHKIVKSDPDLRMPCR
jgi:hypothetical protein